MPPRIRKPRSLQARGQPTAPDFVPAGDVAGAPLFLNIMGHWQDDVPPWNAIYPNWRDRLLKRFVYTETGLSSAVQTVKLKLQTLNYQLNGPERTKKKVQTLLEAPGFSGESFSDIAGKLVDDLLTSDNGAFLELWKPGDPSRDAGKAPCVGFAQLDSRQCFRSFDQEFPVWYTNPLTGQQRKIHRSRVVFASLNIQPQELARGIGFCPTSTVLRWSRMMRSALIYSDEKISGGFTRALGAIKGVTKKQVEDAEAQTQGQKERKGWTVYHGIPFLISPGAEPGQDIDIILKDLASIPDGFDLHQIQQLYACVLAFAFGVDAREFWPATQSGATKADAAIQNMKAQGKMPGYLIQTMEYFWRQTIPESVSFEYDYTDDEADKQRHEIYQLRTSTLQSYVVSGAITPAEMRVQAIADGILDPEVLAGAEMPLTSDDQFTETDETADSGDPTDAPPEQGEASEEKALQAIKAHTGVIAALFIPPTVAQQLYEQVAPALMSAGLTPIPANEYHVTLVYAGDQSFYDDGERRELLFGAFDSGMQFAPFTARVNGFGRFIQDSGDNTNALYISIDAPELPALRQTVYRKLRANLAIEQLHGFTPHLTIAYIPADQGTPPLKLTETTFTIDNLSLAWGDTRYTYPFTAPDNAGNKALARKSINTYRDNLRYAVRGLYSGSLTYFEFLSTFQRNIEYYFTEAWQAGAAMCGMTPGDMTDEERTRLRLEINTEYTFVSGLGNAVLAAAEAQSGLEALFSRVDMWANAYGRVFTVGQTMACADEKLRWNRGPTSDSCVDCLGYNTRVYRASVWRKFLEPYNAMPRSIGLACTGRRCLCSLDPTTDRVTPGFPPRPIGGFKAHTHNGTSHAEAHPTEAPAHDERVPAGH